MHLGPFLFNYSQAESRDYYVLTLSWTNQLVRKPAASFYRVKYQVAYTLLEIIWFFPPVSR